MDAGRLDRLISLQRAGAPLNSYGEPSSTLVEFASVYAHFAPVTDGERMRAGETLAASMVRFTIRYSVDVATLGVTDFVVYEGRTYDINGVKPIGRRQYLEITATARGEVP